MLIAAESLSTEQYIRNLSGFDRERRALTIEHHTERRQLCSGCDFIAVLLRREREARRQWCTHGRIMCPEMQRWHDFYAEGSLTRHQTIGNVDRSLCVWKHYLLYQY